MGTVAFPQSLATFRELEEVKQMQLRRVFALYDLQHQATHDPNPVSRHLIMEYTTQELSDITMKDIRARADDLTVADLYRTTTGQPGTLAHWMHLGKLLVDEYRRRFNRDPRKVERVVDGTMRRINVYSLRTDPWIVNFVQRQ